MYGVCNFQRLYPSFANMTAVLLICLLILWLVAQILNETRNKEKKNKDNEIDKKFQPKLILIASQ